MRVTVDIPDAEWAVLVSRAEAHGLRVPDLVRAGIEEILPRHRPTRDVVTLLVKAGFSDSQIAGWLDLTNHTVATYRRDARLPANHAPGRSGGINRRNKA
jgi:hypothetical protein